jgi:RNA recognition motif. (a.k.a. RRM, RBD, or RNP domain)
VCGGNQLPWSTSNEDLVELFQTTGTVEHAEVVYEGTRSKGVGVVQFATVEEAETAIGKRLFPFVTLGPGRCETFLLTDLSLFRSQIPKLRIWRSPAAYQLQRQLAQLWGDGQWRRRSRTSCSRLRRCFCGDLRSFALVLLLLSAPPFLFLLWKPYRLWGKNTKEICDCSWPGAFGRTLFKP